MFEKIRFEWFIIKEFFRIMKWRIKVTKSLMAIFDMLDPGSQYKLGDDEPWKKGNYYKYLKDFYSC